MYLKDGRIIDITRQRTTEGGWLSTHEDVTDQRRIEKQLAYLAHHDGLTNLSNRVLLYERMQELQRVRSDNAFTLLCIDLDGFKGVNDTFGHAVGDELLKTVADRLRTCVRDTDTVARLGGDEFAIIQVGAKQPRDTEALADRICDTLSAPFNLGEIEVYVGASIGIAVAPKDGTDHEQLYRRADLALYRAKNEGRGTYRFFEPTTEASTKDRHILGLALRKALTDNELELYYQPIVNLQDNSVSGFEALLRWHHPDRGMISPADFIPLAEELGIINQIGSWALKQSCAAAASWPGNIKVAVNVSPLQFSQSDLLGIVKSALAESGLAPTRLELEITESALMRDEEATQAILRYLHDLGVQIAMDDFGTGYSSLGYLRRIPFDKIKIDGTFVQDLSNQDNNSIGIVHAIVGLASGLGVTTTAEGVETEKQLEVIRAEGCTEAQGYFFSPPLPPEDIDGFLKRLPNKLMSAA